MQFSYSGVNTFVLAWLVEKITGYPFQDVLTKEIWYHIGAEADASYIAYRYGIPLTHGGFLSKMRDLARFGLLFTPSYTVVTDSKIISDEHIELIRLGGNPALRANALVCHRSKIVASCITSTSGIEFILTAISIKAAGGGQGLIVNPERDVVVVFTSYFKNDYSEVMLEPLVFEILDYVFK